MIRPVIAIPTEPTTSSPLSLNLNQVQLTKEIRRHESTAIRKLEAGFKNSLLFTEQGFIQELSQYHSFDILTYSISPFSLFFSRPIRRLIYGVGIPPRFTSNHIKRTHTHAKLWICYKYPADKEPGVYLGSANATDMTILDLMIKVNKDQSKLLTEYFDLLWDVNTETK